MEKKLVPRWVLDIVVGGRWWEDAQWGERAWRVGTRHEIDVADTEIEEAAVGYLGADRLFAAQREVGSELGPWIVTKRQVGCWRQGGGTKSGRRGDLTAQFAALGQDPELDEMSRALLGATVDEGALERMGASVVSDGTLTTASIVIEGNRLWDGSLGGAAWVMEIEREFVLEANHAAWRDRQVRRLVSLSAYAVELHADPAPWRELLLVEATHLGVDRPPPTLEVR